MTALFVAVVVVVLVMAGYGLRDVRARRRAWEEFERRRVQGLEERAWSTPRSVYEQEGEMGGAPRPNLED